jgi:signal transduction histidine kinase
MRRLALRTRVLLGTILWTAGLFAAVMHVATVVMLHHPGYARYVHGFADMHSTPLISFAAACMVMGFLLVRGGVSSIEAVRARLIDVRQGRVPRIEGWHPNEVQPLVDDLNALLEHRERAIARALAKAGDLAHGLKTPLALLAQEAERAAAAGQTELAAAIAQQVERMRRQTDYHLAQARAVASGATPGARCLVQESAEGLSRTLLRLHAGRGIDLRNDVMGPAAVRCQREDLDEMLGNLLDNACKWARSRVVLAASAGGGQVVITVDDDGPGLPESMRPAVLQRGVRADEAAPGSGLGLAIVRDLAELYDGTIALSASPLGGLRATLTLPAA